MNVSKSGVHAGSELRKNVLGRSLDTTPGLSRVHGFDWVFWGVAASPFHCSFANIHPIIT
jgi:hypothetical protein